MRTAIASLAALVLLGVCVPAAGAVTLGADLGAEANNAGTCSLMGAASCLFYSGAPGPSFYAPASGTVNTVRVKAGNAVGPMQIVVMRSLYQNHAGDPGHPYFACCFVEQYGPTFTPAANSVTPVATSLTMVEDPTPPPDDFTTNARGDFLALAVLDPDVPVPANADGASFFSGFAPAPGPQSIPAPSPNPIYPSVTGQGYHLLMSADLGAGGAGGGGVGGGPDVGAPFLPLTVANGGQLLGATLVYNPPTAGYRARTAST
jgi:hypothetical protein